jgi:hypothetical protein
MKAGKRRTLDSVTEGEKETLPRQTCFSASHDALMKRRFTCILGIHLFIPPCFVFALLLSLPLLAFVVDIKH